MKLTEIDDYLDRTTIMFSLKAFIIFFLVNGFCIHKVIKSNQQYVKNKIMIVPFDLRKSFSFSYLGESGRQGG